MSRSYPTDLLLTVAAAERSLAEEPDGALARVLARSDRSGLCAWFRAGALTEALDELFGGLHQFPWIPRTEADEVVELTPLGVVRVQEGDDPVATLRGLFFAWSAGNAVGLTDPFWVALADALRDFGHPLPPAPTEEPVHELVPPPAESDDPDVALRADGRAAWAKALFRQRLLPGTSLAAARAASGADETAGRLDARLRYLAARAAEAPYYRAVLPPVTGRADLSGVPVLEKQHLEANTLPRGRGLLSGRRPSGEVMRSGGSSGSPRYVVYSREDWTNMVREAIPQLFALGLAPGDRLVNTLFGGGLYGGLTTSVCELSRMPVECYTTGQLATVDDLLLLTGEGFEANAVLGQPALILPLLRGAKARRPGLRVEKVIYGGTPMSEADKRWLREELGTTVVSSILAANDGAQLGYQCAEMSGSLHHLCEDYNLIEVIGDDGEPVAPGEYGHLLVTCLQKFEGPLVRYRIGDYGRIRTRSCACGLSGPVLEYAGRSDGLVKLMGRRVLHSELLDALGGFGASQLQVEIVPDGVRETVTLRLESPRQPSVEEVRAHLLAHFSLLDSGADNAFDPGLGVFALEVEVHPEGGLPRDPVSGKIRPVLDRRLETAV
jgi:phenylacetate-CoA ligase